MKPLLSYLVAVTVSTGSAASETLRDLRSVGYAELWSGYASITTCVHTRDRYRLGPYIFVCDQFTYEYPYFYGSVTLLRRISTLTYKGRRHIVSLEKLCLAEKPCFAGTILRAE